MLSACHPDVSLKIVLEVPRIRCAFEFKNRRVVVAHDKLNRQAKLLRYQEAVRMIDAWTVRGWAAKDANRANATYITPNLQDLLHNRTTCTTLHNPSAACTTDCATHTTDFMEAEDV
jgi:hypothetical protein